MESNVLIIDGTNLMHRNHFAYPEKITDKNGNRTGAILGTIKQLKKFSEELKATQLYVCADLHRRTFRNEIYAEYKGNRGETDPTLKQQMILLEEFCCYARIPYLKQLNYEADDLMGSLAKNAVKYDLEPLVVSGDKDVFQLIDNNIDVMHVSNKGLIKYGVDEVKEKYGGLNPEQFLDLKALMGDASDNIPGVPGIGEKTGIRLLCEYGNLNGIYENIHQLKGKMRERLEDNKELAYLSKKLATIVTDLDLDYENYFISLLDKKYEFHNDKADVFYKRLNIEKI